MEDKITLLVIVIALFGVFLIGKGITGYTIAKTCCFPPDCAPEDVCNFGNPEIESPSSTQPVSNIYFGAMLFMVAVAVYIILRRKK